MLPWVAAPPGVVAVCFLHVVDECLKACSDFRTSCLFCILCIVWMKLLCCNINYPPTASLYAGRACLTILAVAISQASKPIVEELR